MPLLGTQTDWMNWCGDGLPGMLRDLRLSGEVAPMVAALHPNGPDRRVARLRDGTYWGVCDHGYSEPEELRVDQVSLLELSPKQLRSTLCRALGLRTATTTLAHLSGVSQLGYWEPQPATAFPAWLMIGEDERTLQIHARGVFQQSGLSILIFTPTRAGWSSELESVIRAAGGMLVPLAEVVQAGPDGWTATEDWESFLAEFARRAEFKPGSPTQNKRPRRRRGDVLAKEEAVFKELTEEGKSRARLLKAARDQREPQPKLPPLTKERLATRAGIKPYDITRVFRRRPELAELHRLIHDPDRLQGWWANHRRQRPCS